MKPTVEDIKAAYVKTGMIPVKHSFLRMEDGKKCGCAIGALAMADDEFRDTEDDCRDYPVEHFYHWSSYQMGDYFAAGLQVGFDRVFLDDSAARLFLANLNDADVQKKNDWLEGFNVGKAAGELLLKGG